MGRFPSYLRKHIRQVHSNERPFVCHCCGAAFKSVSALNLHKQTHREECHVCDVCGFQTRLWRVFVVHRKVHEDKQLSCPECNYMARRREDLRKHIMSLHRGRPRRKRYEEAVAQLLTTCQVPFVREHIIRYDGGPRKFARIDFFWCSGDRAVLLECDEYAHMPTRHPVQYECIRMWLSYKELLRKGFKSVHFIRYNPHATLDVRPTPEERSAAIARAVDYVPDGFAITYIFYHMLEQVPKITLSPDYTLKEYVRSDGL